MTKRAVEKILEGVRDAAAIIRGEADPETYRVHHPKPDVEGGGSEEPPPVETSVAVPCGTTPRRA